MIAKLQYITQETAEQSHVQLAKEACINGVRWVQLRVKNQTEKEYIQIGSQVKEICKKFGATLIINDNVFVAKEVGADGVHLGQNDMSPDDARDILGNNFIIGCTANTIDDIRSIAKKNIDYIGLGPYTKTATKKHLKPILGSDGYRKIQQRLIEDKIKIPIIAIGGIKLKDIDGLMSMGMYGIAVSGLITNSKNKKELIAEINNKINAYEPA